MSLIALTGLAAMASCVTETTTTRRPASPRPSTANTARPQPDLPPDFGLQPRGESLTIDVRAVIGLLGSVPYDDFKLPLVSPDGTYLVTEAGIAPSWETILAEPGASVPDATRLEIYRLDLRTGIDEAQRQPAQLVATVQEPVLLGRSSNTEGFIIEAPQPDGSRWLGLASWTTGAIRWLVQDEHVNAFASLGPDDRLAWSRRTSSDGHFGLVVQKGGRTWSFGAGPQDWLLPHWGGRDDGLFVMVLEGGRLDLVHVIAASEAATRQSLRRTPVATNANVYIAYQSMNATVTTVGLPRPQFDQIAFVHPARQRAAVWRPFAGAGAAPVLLEPESLAAVPDESDVSFVTMERDLLRQSLLDNQLRVKARILAGTIIPRRVANTNWHSVLLAPQQGRIGLSVLRLLPPQR